MMGYFEIYLVFSLGKERPEKSKQANTALSPTPRSVSPFWIFGKFNCRLRAVLACLFIMGADGFDS